MLSQGGELGLSQLPRGRHLEKSSTLRLKQHLLPGPHKERKCNNRDGKYHLCGVTPINESELPEVLW